MSAVCGAAVAALVLVGCAGGGSGSLLPPNPEVRYFNASPDSTALDILLDDVVKANNLAYLGSTTEFASVEAQDYDVVVKEDGQTFELWAEAFAPERDNHYAVVALGLENYGNEPLKRLRLGLFELDRTTPVGNKSRLFVVHAFHRPTGFDTPAIDFQNPGNNPQFKIGNIAFGTMKSILVDSGAHDFVVRRSGTEQVYVSTSPTLEAGKIYLVLVSGVQDAVGAMAPQAVFIPITPED